MHAPCAVPIQSVPEESQKIVRIELSGMVVESFGLLTNFCTSTVLYRYKPCTVPNQINPLASSPIELIAPYVKPPIGEIVRNEKLIFSGLDPDKPRTAQHQIINTKKEIFIL